MEFQKINIEIDGVDKEAKIIKVINIDNREYAIYTVDNGDDTSDIFSSGWSIKRLTIAVPLAVLPASGIS